CRRAAQLQGDGRAAHRLLEAEVDLALHIPAAAGRLLGAGTAAAEEVVEQPAEPAEVEVLHPDALAAASGETTTRKAAAAERAAAEQATGFVVLGPLLGVGQHAVGAPDLLEALLRLLVARVR